MKVTLTPPAMRKVVSSESLTLNNNHDDVDGTQVPQKAVRPSHMDFNKIRRKQFFEELASRPLVSQRSSVHESLFKPEEFKSTNDDAKTGRYRETYKAVSKRDEEVDSPFASQISQLKYIDDVIESSVIKHHPTMTASKIVQLSPEGSKSSSDFSPPLGADDSQRPKLQLNRDMLRRRESSPDLVSPVEKKSEVTLVKPKPYPFVSPVAKQEVTIVTKVSSSPKHDRKQTINLELSPTQLKAPPGDDIGKQLDLELQAAKERLTAKLSPRSQNTSVMLSPRSDDTEQGSAFKTKRNQDNLTGRYHSNVDIATGSHPPTSSPR